MKKFNFAEHYDATDQIGKKGQKAESYYDFVTGTTTQLTTQITRGTMILHYLNLNFIYMLLKFVKLVDVTHDDTSNLSLLLQYQFKSQID